MLSVQQEAFGPVLGKPQVAQEQLLSFTVGDGECKCCLLRLIVLDSQRQFSRSIECGIGGQV